MLTVEILNTIYNNGYMLQHIAESEGISIWTVVRRIGRFKNGRFVFSKIQEQLMLEAYDLYK